MLHVFSHDMCMWLNPVPLPLFFSCQAAVRRFILELENSEAGRCRAGTSN